MRAVLCKEWGTPESLVVEEVAAPEPGPGEVRISVHAAGLNFADTLMIAGKYQEKPAFPFSPGLECAGIVDACGPGVSGLREGDRVMAVKGHGGYAEALVLAAERVFPIPDSMPFDAAAGFAVAYGTSHVALRHRANLRAGEALLVHGAAGGVGLTAVEIGKTMGAEVIATARGAAKLELAAQYGADHGIDNAEEDLRERVLALTEGRGADVIYDPVGGDVFDTSLRCINWAGRILVIGFASGRIPEIPANRLLIKNCAAVGVFWGAYADRDPAVLRDSFAELFDWFAAGKLKPHISHRFPLEQATEAMNLLLSRKTTGKVVLTMA